LTPQELRIWLATLANVDARYIYVVSQGRVSTDTCCVRYTIFFNADSGDSHDITSDQGAVVNAIGSNPDFEPDSNSTSSVISSTSGSTAGDTVNASSVLVPFFGLLALLLSLF